MNKVSTNNMATTNPKLLRWFASKNPTHVFVKLLPLIVVFGYFILKESSFELDALLYYGLGLLTWSLFEYVTHRWLYHTIFKNKRVQWFFDAFHLHHHHVLKDYRVLNAGIFLIYPIAIFFWGLVYLISQNIQAASFFSLGTLSYYFFYENIHYYIHYKIYTTGYMQMIQKYHLFHHYMKWNKNYGNTITLWDRIFNTYDASYKKFTLTEKQVDDLITMNEDGSSTTTE